MKPTTVISVRGQNREELLADENFRYVGRAVPRAGWSNSDFGNPFTVSAYGNRAVKLFERCALAALGLGDYPHELCNLSWRFKPLTYWGPMAAKIPGLRNRTLGCWCGDWSPGQPIATPCHAIVLARLADAMAPPLESR